MFCYGDRCVVSYRGKNILLLAFFWTTGFILGSFLGMANRDAFMSVIRNDAVSSSAFFVRYLIYSAVYLISLLSVVSRCRFFVFGFSFAEGIAFATVLVGLVGCFPTCGWLYASLFLAPKILFLVPLFLFWNSCLELPISAVAKRLLPNLAAFIPVLIIEYNWIKPLIFVLLDRL